MPKVGDTVICSQGVWTETPSSYAYRPHRDGVPIGPAQASNEYVLVDADANTMFSWEVIVSNAEGVAQTFTEAVGPIEAADAPDPGGTAPSFTMDPAISGTAKEGTTLTCSDGTYTGTEPITISRQWKADATNVGTDSATYTPGYDDIGKVITCVVTLTNAEGADVATTAATAAVVQAPELLGDEYWDYQDLPDQGYASTDPIGSWLGRVLGTAATSAGSARPSYRADSGGVPGAADFDGTDDRIDIDAIASWFNPGEDVTVAYAYTDMADGSSAFRYVWCAGNAASNTQVSLYARFNNHYPFMRRAGATIDTLATVDPDDDWVIVTLEEAATGGGSRAASTDIYVSPDDATPAASDTGSFTDESAITTFTWGCRRITGGASLGFYFEGDLRGLLIKRGLMTATERARWERYCTDQGWV